MGHVAYAVVLRARGDHASARRELLAAEQLAGSSAQTAGFDDHLLVRHELALLNVEMLGAEHCADLLDALRRQATRVWQQRRQRLTLLQQARRQEHLETERVRTEAALLRDPLTGLGNRRHFDRLMADVPAGGTTLPLSLLVIDVDRFKAINDAHSHSTGDEVLRAIGQLIAGHCRAGQDIPIRYAGDEFTIFLATDLTGAVAIAERIRAAVAATDFGHLTPGTPVSISTGVAALRAGMTAQDLFQAADANLYHAKRAGRNRVAA
jgi:diguanylate cyclase (GGDEF)-like protein